MIEALLHIPFELLVGTCLLRAVPEKGTELLVEDVLNILSQLQQIIGILPEVLLLVCGILKVLTAWSQFRSEAG